MIIDHLSYSSMSCFVTCPKQFELSKIKKAPSTDVMAAGKDLHAVLANDLLSKNGVPSVGGPRLKSFFKYIIPEATGVEEKFELDMIGQKFTGAIDAYFALPFGNRIIIIDWKSNKSDFVDPEQLKIYALALSKKYCDIDIFECYFFYVNQDFPEKHEFYKEDIEEFEATLYDTAVQITSTEVFDPTPGSHCTKCQYVSECPIAKDLQIVVINDMISAKAIAEKLFVAVGFVEHIKDKLKEYMLENSLEEIRVNDEERFYILNASPQLRTGKIKKEKEEKEKAEKKPRKSTADRVKAIKEKVEKKSEEKNAEVKNA